MKTNIKNKETSAQIHSRKHITHFTHSTHFLTRANAFTLAETLITLAIIGVVAAITIPSLVKNYNEKAWSTAQDVFTKRLEVATRQMNTEEKLAGYSSTMDFVNELKRYIKITRVCASNELTKCFENTILTEDPKEIDITSLSTSENFTKDNWGTETVGVQFANGVNALIAYNPQTDQQPYNNQFSATEASMAILYDVSGHKNPNTIGKDINQNANVKKLGCVIRKDLVGGMCISKILVPITGYSGLSKEECEQIADEGYGNNKAYCGTVTRDYWAGAVKACGGTKNMPNQDQLTQLAEYIYDGSSIDSSGWIMDKAMNTTKATPFLVSSYSNMFEVWSGEEGSNLVANYREFNSTYTYWSNEGYRHYAGRLAVCLDN